MPGNEKINLKSFSERSQENEMLQRLNPSLRSVRRTVFGCNERIFFGSYCVAKHHRVL